MSCCSVALTVTASGGFSEEEVEEKKQELRNELDEQYGQSMMAIKESMSAQYEESMKVLKKDLDTAKQQVGCRGMFALSKLLEL